MWVDILIDPCRMMMMKKCRGKLNSPVEEWMRISTRNCVRFSFPLFKAWSPQYARFKHLIACNNAKVKVKDFSGCVTGVIITTYTILDLAALMMYISQIYTFMLYTSSMWEIWVVLG